MTTWVTHQQAAQTLGCHVSNVPKLIAKGKLTTRGAADRKLPSLNRAEVVALAQRRAQERELRAESPQRRYQRVDYRPDNVHDWLTPRQVAQLLGVTRPAVIGRITRERLPAVRTGRRYWVRRDLLEQVEAARLARKTRRP